MIEVTTFILDNWRVVLPVGIILLAIPFFLNKFFPSNAVLNGIKQLIQIILTNWVNLVVILLGTFLFSIVNSILSANFTFIEAIFGSAFLVLGYGIMFWLGFFILIGTLDMILFSVIKKLQYVNHILTFEWIIISSPFIYWIFKYNQWIFLIAIITFLIGQYLRRTYIFKILE